MPTKEPAPSSSLHTPTATHAMVLAAQCPLAFAKISWTAARSFFLTASTASRA
eukprot:CAMPEP_0119118178 /NCGR_PEP_ID=MMETSP1310-20130426/95_1 /TAXON_ID=464262 /ORGANISM="Genus nov. species nov., Strain RCC2339" /LENGTH=52 /DNA_ID=CAMNT_0007107517 /DNA_START=94 /DNA_END=252 /DNA_ORIENTATION=-